MMKRMTRKTTAVILAVLCVCALAFSGCKKEEAVTLRVLTDAVRGSKQHVQLFALIKEFQQNNKGVTILCEQIPTDADAREAMLQKTRTAVMANKGPDVFLLTTSTENDLGYEAGNGLLFKDVNQAIRNGLFADISKYYDADTALGKEAFVPAVMEAGVYDGGRYVLPLQFDLPVCYVDQSQFAEAGFSMDDFDGGLPGLMEAITASGDAKMAGGCQMASLVREYFFNLYPELLDYDKQEVLVTADELIGFMTSLQKMRELKPYSELPYQFDGYIQYLDDAWYWADVSPLYAEGLDKAVYCASVAGKKEVDLAIVPLTAADGTLTADVTYYGAVGAGCDEPELAYAFLREFLSEASQWGDNVESTYDPLLSVPGWPVRTVNAAQHLFSNELRYYQEKGHKRIKNLRPHCPDDDAFPDWHEAIDQARFPLPLEKIAGDWIWFDLTAPEAEPAAIDNYADKLIKELVWHLAEG